MAKKKVICDTDVLIEYWDKTKYRHSAILLTLEQSIELDNVVLSAITKMELMLGAVNKANMARMIKQLNRFMLHSSIMTLHYKLLTCFKGIS